MAVHLLRSQYFGPPKKGLERVRSEYAENSEKFRLDQLWCCVRILLKPEARATGHGHASAAVPVPTTEAANAELRSQVSNKTTRSDGLGSEALRQL
jgi:hypothetical protein